MGIISPNFGRKRKNIIGVALLLGLIILTWRIVPNFFQTGSDRTFFKKYQQIDAPKKDDALAATTEKASAERTEVIDKDANSVSTLKQCYRRKETTESDRGNPIELFDDVLLSHRKPRINQTIFFIVTRCSTDNLVHLNTRQLCAIESAARVNENMDVFVLFASPAGFSNNSSLHSPYAIALKAHSNVFFRNVNLWTFAYETPFHDWMQKGELFESKHFVSHASDYLRFLTLYKFGGIYMDLEVVEQKSFEKVKLNFAGAESEQQIGSAIISFSQNGFGHEIASRCAKDFTLNFNGSDWANNGPYVLTRVMQAICKTESTINMTRERCSGFKVYPPNEFYAVSWSDWRMFFDSNSTDITLALVKDSLAVHVWNRFTEYEKIDKNAAYGILAKKNCPNVYVMSGDYF